MVTIRNATEADLPAINAIYNHYVACSTCTYQEEPETMASRQQWWHHHGPQHPVIVAQDADQVIGWGSLSAFHGRCAYRFTVEDSIYVHHAHHRRGLGRALLAELIHRAEALGHHSIMALISADQHASLRLHAALGFAQVGRLLEVGYKFDQWLDVVYLQRKLR